MATSELGTWGLEKHLDVAVELVAARPAVASLAKAVAAAVDDIDEHPVTVRLAGLEGRMGEVALTLAIDLGTVSQVRDRSDYSVGALRLLANIVLNFGAYMPTLVQVPAHDSTAAAAARRWLAKEGSDQSTDSATLLLEALSDDPASLAVA